MRTLRVPGFLLLAALMVAACGSSASPGPSGGASEPPASSAPASSEPSAVAGACEVLDTAPTDAASVSIAGFAFDPAQITIKVGQAVTWTNEDAAGHTATLDDGSCSTGTLQKGVSGTIRFDAPGEYPYKCAIHPSRMTGTVIVEP